MLFRRRIPFFLPVSQRVLFKTHVHLDALVAVQPNNILALTQSATEFPEADS